ncbi:Leucine-rich repeat containing protein [Entamoeba marina]
MQRIQLEEIYLANVVLFFDGYVTTQTFSFINKKCLDTLKMLRINPCFQVNSSFEYNLNHFEQRKSFEKELQLFPNIETIQLRKEMVDYINDIPDRINTISISSPIAMSKIQHIKEKITEICICVSCDVVDLNQFPSLQKVTIKPLLKPLFDIPNLSNTVVLCSRRWVEGIDPRIIILKTKDSLFEMVTSNGIEQHQLEKYDVSKLVLKCSTQQIDIQRFTNLLSLENNHSHKSVIPPTSLTHIKTDTFHTTLQNLKSLSYNSNDDALELPLSLTKLEIVQSNCEIKNSNVIRELTIKNRLHPFPFSGCNLLTSLVLNNSYTVTLTELVHLQHVTIINSQPPHDVNTFYPTSLKTLYCSTNMLPQSLGITKLVLIDESQITLDLRNFMLLKELTIKNIASETIHLSSSVKELCCLNKRNQSEFHFEKFINLSTVMFDHITDVVVHLPNTITNIFLTECQLEIQTDNEKSNC